MIILNDYEFTCRIQLSKGAVSELLDLINPYLRAQCGKIETEELKDSVNRLQLSSFNLLLVALIALLVITPSAATNSTKRMASSLVIGFDLG